MDIKPEYQHSKAGLFMFNLCANWTKFILKHKWLYYVLACTWGAILTIIGLFITLCLFIFSICGGTDIYLHKYNWIYYIKVGPKYWGGFEMGLMFCRDQKSDDDYINQHEWGHTFQNTILGLFYLPVVGIPSCIRYWIFEIRESKGLENKPYNSIWFEDSASQCGKYADWYVLVNRK